MRTNRIISNNKPDIIIRDNKFGTCMSIDTAISGDKRDQERSREDFKYMNTL